MAIEDTLASIDRSLARIAVCLEEMSEDIEEETATAPVDDKPKAKTKAKPAAKAKAPANEPQAVPDLAAVRAALTGIQKKVSADAARAILKDVGGTTTLGKLTKDKYAAVLEAATERASLLEVKAGG